MKKHTLNQHLYHQSCVTGKKCGKWSSSLSTIEANAISLLDTSDADSFFKFSDMCGNLYTAKTSKGILRNDENSKEL